MLVITRLFEINDWKDIKNVLEDHFHSKITINTLFANKAIIKSSLCNLKDKVGSSIKWQRYGLFHILVEKRNGSKHSKPDVVKDYWSLNVFKAIGGYFEGLESISLETMNLINCLEAKIKVSQYICSILPATVELQDAFRGNIFLNFGNIKAIEAPKAIEEALLISDFNNPIDVIIINQILLDEGGTPNMLKPEWDFPL